jgi:rhamnosyltransferase
MNISVIIPTYNAEPYLPKLLESLKQQTVNFELIIIDSSSTDNTLSLVKSYADKIITINQSEFDHGGTRTKAAKEASGDILLFLTQDALPTDKNTFKTIIEAFEHTQTAVAYGRQLAYEDTNLFGTHLRLFNYPSTSHIRSLEDKEQYGIKTTFLSDSFAAYKKSAMQEVDYFKDGLIVGEDNHIGAKLLLKGHNIAYVAQAQVYHSHSYTPFQEFQRYFDIGVFHIKESWILDTFGKAEGEGKKYIKSELNYLFKQHAYGRIPEFILRNGLKLLGYKLGKIYTILPQKLIFLCSMHKSWWDK